MEESKRIGVYGLGRFGSFWAKELAKHGFSVVGYGRSAKTAPEGVRLGTEDEVLASSVLFYCVSISAFGEVLDRTASRIGKDTVVMDTCSVKLHPAKLMREKLPAKTQCIATHPMFGPDSGKDGLDGLPFVICPVHCSQETLTYWMDEFKRWNLQVLPMSCDQHDREAAWSQGITHFIGRTLSELSLGETELATKGYRTLLTVVEQTCNDPLQLFYDLQRYNPYAKQMRMGLKGALDTVMEALKKQEEGR
ncbi:MAG: prephenate dehydrogenase/arogenate dehydrogenase family protein [Sphaerochaeta sp.]|uniref:prephenate dehydrogenase/arogenate dehydrogenase family protein n=1 Tax=Sphaerochaeta sp. TaxID=1972642 RepID=UPI002FC715A4